MAIIGAHEEFLSLKFSRLSKFGEPAKPIVSDDIINKIKMFLEKYFIEKNQDIVIDVIQK